MNRGNRGRGRGRGSRFRRGHGRTYARHQEFNRGQGEGEASGPEVVADADTSQCSPQEGEANTDLLKTAEEDEEHEREPVQKGTDYSVLLSSAGSYFTQFRLAEEKAWESELSVFSKMFPVLPDLSSLAQCIQELPLHKKLNIEAEFTQMATPVEVPCLASAPEGCKSDAIIQRLTAGEVKPDHRGHGAHATIAGTGSTEMPADDGDEELDALLSLGGTSPDLSQAVAIPAEKLNLPVFLEAPEEIVPAAEAGNVKKTELTVDDLEEWLDDMIF